MAIYFRYPFGVTGDRTTVPYTAGDGAMNYQAGYGEQYSLPQLTDPLARNVERMKMNQLMYDVTSNIQQYQQFGVPDFITTSDNGGTPFSYSKGATVRYNGGSGFHNYISLIDSNTVLPTDTNAWQQVGGAGRMSVNVFFPEDYGAEASVTSSSTGENLGGGLFQDANYAFQASDVGRSWWQDGATTRTITAVAAGVATISPAPYGTTNITWMMGVDDTAAIQAAYDAAAAASGGPADGITPSYGPVPMGGVVLLTAGKQYGVFNSSTSFSGGKLSAIVMNRRCAFMTNASANEQQASIVQLPRSYGHVMSPPTTGNYMDFVTLSDFTIECFGDFSPNSLNGIDFEIPYGNYARVDPYNRFQRVCVRRAKQDGFRFKGKGHTNFRDISAYNSSRYGAFIDRQYDWFMIGGDFGGCGKTGLRIYGGGGQITGIKSFYNGSAGTTVDLDCANIVIDGDQMRAGFVYGSNIQCQESRGSSLIITVGNCYLDNVQALDPNRNGINSGTLPSVLAGIHFKGEGCRLNTVNGMVSPSVAVYTGTNWNADTYSVYVDDYSGAAGGPQLNQGKIWTYRATQNAGPATQVGIQYSGSGAAVGGAGITNGQNPNLYIDGVSCAATLGVAPASGDLIEILDISDTTANPLGTLKKVPFSLFGGGVGSPFTGSNAQLLAAGLNGNTNPAFNVDTTTASSATGFNIKSAAAGGGVLCSAISSGTDEALLLAAKGVARVSLISNGNEIVQAGVNQITLTNAFRGFTSNTAFQIVGTGGTQMTASTECLGFDVNLAQTVQHSTGALTTQRDIRFRPSTHSFVAASTLTNAYGVYIDGAPIAGTNATITNSYTLYLGGNAVGSGTASYGLVVNPNTGATTNWGTFFFGKTGYDATNTAGGTTGAQTINKPSGTVNFAAAATSLVVTNSLCTTSSIIFAVIRTNDTTALIKNVIPAAGSFTINLNAAATAETSVGFFIIN